MSPARWKLARDRRLAGGDEPEELKARRAEIKAKFGLGQAVYDRRTELGLSQTQLAERAGMTQPQISNIEQAGGTPTLPLLRRLAKALDAQLTIDLDDDSAFVFTPRVEQTELAQAKSAWEEASGSARRDLRGHLDALAKDVQKSYPGLTLPAHDREQLSLDRVELLLLLSMARGLREWWIPTRSTPCPMVPDH
ncbi:helix-turn-helix transcriptional regulator [Streptomyces sp. NPDC004362]|uniref:helix-turn-helix domain-containing protein n=1 Tax=Streptomyces sp. NPDC004362 TaxID=3154456 RepID=UPI0033A0DBBC